MSINLIENNELSALAIHKGPVQFNVAPSRYADFLGIGVKKKKAKAVAAVVATSQLATPFFKSQMVKLYNTVKSDPEQKSIALSNLNKPEGLWAVYEVTRLFGSPTTKAELEAHNQYVNVFLDHYIPERATKEQDCDNLSTMVEEIDADIQSENEKIAVGGKGKNVTLSRAALRALAERKKQVSELIASSKCVSKAEAAAAEQEQKQTLDALKAATGSTGADSGLSNKTLIYGVAGLFLLTAVVLLFKKK